MVFFCRFKFVICLVISIVPLLANTTDLLENTVEAFWHSLYPEKEYSSSQLEGIWIYQKREKINDKGCYFELIDEGGTLFCQVLVTKNITIFSTLYLSDHTGVIAVPHVNQHGKLHEIRTLEEHSYEKKEVNKWSQYKLINHGDNYCLPFKMVHQQNFYEEVEDKVIILTISQNSSGSAIFQFKETVNLETSFNCSGEIKGVIKGFYFKQESETGRAINNVVSYIGTYPTQICCNGLHESQSFKDYPPPKGIWPSYSYETFKDILQSGGSK